MEKRLKDAYTVAEEFALSHYENFPVISKFVPHFLRKHVAVIYKFARDADDIADEGNDNAENRLKKLDEYESYLTAAMMQNYQNDFWLALYTTITDLHLTPQYFYDLLKAFKQDVNVNRYVTFDEVQEYCKYSANPVGRLVLELHGIKYEMANEFSDKICTALQITNFYQDVSVDAAKNRIYLPLEEMQKYGVSEKNILSGESSENFKQLMKLQVERAEELFREGRKLTHFLPTKLKIQIKWTILGGECILQKIKLLHYDVFLKRPTLSKFDYIRLMVKALL